MKNFYILVLGDSSVNHIHAISTILHKNSNMQGFTFIPYNSDEGKFFKNVKDELDKIYKQKIEPIIIKGFNIHTEDYIRPLIKYYKAKHPNEKFFLSHCACFDDFILTDGALLTKYTKDNIEAVIKNAVKIRNYFNYLYPYKEISMLNAGGDTNPNTAPEGWLDIYNDLEKETEDYKLEMTQLDTAISYRIRLEKMNKTSNVSSIIIPSSINEGNSIWKSLTVMANKSLAGIVVGIPMYIGLTSRTDSEESILKTLDYLLHMFNKDNNIKDEK